MGNLLNARNKLEQIINREWKASKDFVDKYKKELKKRSSGTMDWLYPSLSPEERLKRYMCLFGHPYFLRKNMPEIIGKGEHQLVLELGYGYVAKIRIIEELHNCYRHRTSFVCESGLPGTQGVLRKLGFNAPKHHYVGVHKVRNRFKILESGYGIVVAPDLRQGNRYKLFEIDEADFSKIRNGGQLQKELQAECRRLQSFYRKEGSYCLKINNHVTDDNKPNEAIEHMFFIQYNPLNKNGILVMGDLDNVILIPKVKSCR